MGKSNPDGIEYSEEDDKRDYGESHDVIKIKESYSSDLLNAISSLEHLLSDDGGMVRALSLGCTRLNYTTAPLLTLIKAREKLQIIKKEVE